VNWFKKIAYDQEGYIQELSRKNLYPFKEWFDESGRAYIPFAPEGSETQEGVDQYVAAELAEKGYQITDYRKGYCSKGNRVSRIGKVLNSLKQRSLNEIQNKYQNINQEQDPIRYQIFQNQMQTDLDRNNKYYNELIETFTNSAYRSHQSKQDSGFMIVISQDPHDVAQMSTGRNWTSCMDLGGQGKQPGSHHEDIFCEVQNGGLVAYLIRANDQEIKDPLARIHIRRFDNRAGKSVAIPENSVYGNEIEGFQETVKSWLYQQQGDILSGIYKRKGGEYSDSFGDNMLITPDDKNTDDILKWLRGEGEDAQYSTWEVFDNLYLEFQDYNDDWGYEDLGIEDESKTFQTKEEAEKYLEERNKYSTEIEEYYRESLAEMRDDPEWTEIDEETGKYQEQRFWLQEKKTDHRSNMTNEAIKIILNAPKGTYSVDVLKEIKDMLFGGKILSSPRQGEFIQAFPELFSNEEINRMKDTDQLSIYKKLSPEKQEQQKQQWASYLNDALDNPNLFITEELQKRIRERDRATDVNSKVRAEDSVGLHYTVTLEDWLFSPLQEIFKPIPEPVIQKLVNFGMNFTKEDNPVAPYKNIPKYDKQIQSRIVATFSHTKSDTPTVQNFYKQMLPLWEDNRETYYDNFSSISIDSLGSAIGDLGENGRDFLPFIENKILEERESVQKLEKSIKPEQREWSTTKDLLRRAYKKIEKLYNIKQSIDPNISDDSLKYRWTKSKNWYKKAQSDNKKIILAQLQGEWWVDDNGTALYADGDIGDYNHEMQVIETILSDYFEMEEIEDLSNIPMDDMIERGMNKEEIEAVVGTTDAREYAVKHWGWKRVLGNNVETLTLTNADLNTIANGLYDCYGDIVEQSVFNIEVIANNSWFTSVPYPVISAGDVMGLREYKNL
jgi:hypothetical protein